MKKMIARNFTILLSQRLESLKEMMKRSLPKTSFGYKPVGKFTTNATETSTHYTLADRLLIEEFLVKWRKED